ncbi:MAG: hypothetical protein JNM07_07285 [Phycisphaerae bacterium]|nr:hypothetical protein [Phycisphaerae bacterium]
MQDAMNNRETYTDELSEALAGFADDVSSLIEAEHWVQSTATNALSRARWLQLQALDGDALQAWIRAEIERAHQNIMAACERGGCVLPDDQPKHVREAIGLAERIADSLLNVGNRSDLRKLTTTIVDAVEGLYGSLSELESAPEPPPSWTKAELQRATAAPGVPATSARSMGRILYKSRLPRRKKGRRYGKAEVQRLIEVAPLAAPDEAERCVYAWTRLLNRLR